MVSVIVPVHNASSTISEFMGALLAQTFPSRQVEIIMIDNNSVDNTADLLAPYPVKVLTETDKQNPYAARNRGLKIASGEIIAMTDANKIPDVHWIEHGVRALNETGADIVGGNIQFKLPPSPSVSEKYDAMTFNNNRFLVNEEGGSAAGNLFVKRRVVEDIGLFPDDLRSGMDIWWTQKAVRAGYKISFAENAIVYCIPRAYKGVLKKAFRVGTSHPLNLRASGKPKLYIWSVILRTFMPPKPSKISRQAAANKFQGSRFLLWWVAWSSKIMMGVGRLKGLFMINRMQ